MDYDRLVTLIYSELSKLSICSILVLLSHFLRLGCCHLIILKLHCILEVESDKGLIKLRYTCLNLLSSTNQEHKCCA